MKCEEVMKKIVECISPETPAVTAAQRMRSEGVGFLPICRESKEVLGVITDRDIAIRLVAQELPPTTPVRDIMTLEVVACSPEDSVRRAEELMSAHRKSRILCIDDQRRVVGVISLSDIAQQDTGHAARVLRNVTLREVRA